ncbi:MAG: calcium-binding protein, partial [Selenomonadaceae bacterium]|nr:calcium-binding protein [Selenomonadaceae bacterium]
SVRDDSELWFVGATAKMNHGIDFSGISDALNITLNTDYEADVESFRINNIHSIKGGAGLTTITGSDKDDTIIAGTGSTTIDGGDGNNLVDLTDSSAAQIVLNGNTTVEGFHTRFGEGSDTIYIDGDPAGVEFKDGVLTFGNSTDSLTLSDVTTTAKVNIYHERRKMLNKGVFIAAGDWYKVEASDLTVDAGEEVYFVGTSAETNAGVDFSGISSALNVTMDTAYVDSEDYVPGTTTWINSVYSLKGGAGLTTITGSKQSDTIFAGTGATTINAAGGDDVISLGSASALVEYNSNDGNDLIQGFNKNSTLSISGAKYSSKKSGDDLIVTVGEDKLTLEGAADLSANIIGEQYSVEDELSDLTNGYLSSSPNYGEPVTVQSEVDTLLASGDLNGNMALLLEDQSADFRKSTGKKSVTLAGSSDQDISFNSEGGNRAIVGEDANGTKNISLGGGGDVVLVSDSDAKVNIDASAGNDVIVSKDSKVSVNLNGGKTDLFVTGGRMTLNGYDASTGMGFGTSYESILEAINDGTIYFDNGKLSLDSAVIDFNGVTSGVLNFFDLEGNLQKVAQASPDESLDLSKETANFILVPDKDSTLIGGSGDDTVFAFEGSRIDAGAGKNSIFLEERAANAEGVTIVLDSSGRNTVQNFTAGFDDTSDVLFFGANDTVDFKFDGTNLTVKSNDNSRCGLITDIASDAPFVEISAADDNAPVKIVVAQKDATITVDDELADFYRGDKSGVDFTNYDGNLMANLGSMEGSIGAGEVLFSAINKITAGSGHNTIIGSDANETLIAGKSDNSIYGG